MVNFGQLKAEIDWWVWGTPEISTGFVSWLHYCTNVTQLRSTKLCTMFGRLLSWYAIYTFSGALGPQWNFDRCKIHCILDLHSAILAALLHGTQAVCVSQTLRRSVEGATYIWQGGHHIWHQPTF